MRKTGRLPWAPSSTVSSILPIFGASGLPSSVKARFATHARDLHFRLRFQNHGVRIARHVPRLRQLKGGDLRKVEHISNIRMPW